MGCFLKKIGVLVYYDKRVKYSLNAITAVLDNVEGVNTILVEDEKLLPDLMEYVGRKYHLCVYASSLLTTMLVDEEYYMFIRELNEVASRKNCISVVGGSHASGDPVGSITKLGYKYVFIGEAEESLREFMESLRDGLDPLSVKGIFYRDEGGLFRYTDSRKPIDLDKYSPFPFWRYLYNPIEITRGCPYGCFYCQVSYMHGFNHRHRSIDNVVKYAEIMAKHSVKDLRFISPNSLSYGSVGRKPNLGALEDLLNKLYERVCLKHGARIFYGSFPSEVRPEYVDEDVARVLKKYVSNREIIVGAQSGSDRQLKSINRQHTIEDVFNAVDILNRHGFKTSVDFIIGLPGETEDDLIDTLNALKKLVAMNSRIHLHYYMPLPGTPFCFREPSRVPEWFRREIAKIIGMGRAYGEWVKQEEISWRIVDMRNRGLILPRINLW